MTLYDQVRSFVAEQSGEPLDVLLPETRLLSDLRWSCETTDNFLAAYAKRFQVDISAFRANHHFGDDRFDPLFPIMLSIFKIMSPLIRQKLHVAAPRDITLYHLATCAERKIWAVPPIHTHRASAAGQVLDVIQGVIGLSVLVIALFCVFVGATLVGFAIAQWPHLTMDPVTVIVGPAFLIFGIGYPLWSFRKTQAWMAERFGSLQLSRPNKEKVPVRDGTGTGS